MSKDVEFSRKRLVELDDVFAALADFECDHPAASLKDGIRMVYSALECLALDQEYDGVAGA